MMTDTGGDEGSYDIDENRDQAGSGTSSEKTYRGPPERIVMMKLMRMELAELAQSGTNIDAATLEMITTTTKTETTWETTASIPESTTSSSTSTSQTYSTTSTSLNSQSTTATATNTITPIPNPQPLTPQQAAGKILMAVGGFMMVDGALTLDPAEFDLGQHLFELGEGYLQGAEP
jgi:hypothetical protein